MADELMELDIPVSKSDAAALESNGLRVAKKHPPSVISNQHREPWLRNEATLLGGDNMKFKNPFGDLRDGTESAAFASAIGRWFGAS
jgi:hypothetical protein